MSRFPALLGLLILTTGCTSRQLKQSTIRQSETLGDIYQQQVMDNLAKFVQNPDALPDFALPSQGSSTITDSVAQGGSGIGWTSTGFGSATLGLPQGGRQVNLGWTLDPVRDPHKLALMRCAYQKAVAGCCQGAVSTTCPDCNAKLEQFLGKNKDCAESHGCWFHYGCKKEIPKECGCLPIGHYCGTFVWVTPDGQGELTKLVLNILDFAFRDPTPPDVNTKDVIAYFNASGGPATEATAAVVVKATLDASEPLVAANGTSLLVKEKLLVAAPKGDGTPGAEADIKLKAVPRRPRTLDDKANGGLYELKQQLDALPSTRPR